MKEQKDAMDKKEEVVEKEAVVKETAPVQKNDAEPVKIIEEKDDTNMAFFKVGDEVELKGLSFVCKTVRGVELILSRKDFR